MESVTEVDGPMDTNGGDCEAVLSRIADAGVDVMALAQKLQIDGRDSFNDSWHAMIKDIASKTASMADA